LERPAVFSSIYDPPSHKLNKDHGRDFIEYVYYNIITFHFLVISSTKYCKFYFLLAISLDPLSVLTLYKGGIFFRGNTYGSGKRFQKIAVIAETAQAAGFRYRTALGQQNLSSGNPLCGNVLVDGGAGGIFEDLA
jgi:hypothetical protein